MAKLTERLTPYAGSLVVAEPTAGTWLPLAAAVGDVGYRIALVAIRDSARLCQALSGANKTDLIDAGMLASCPNVVEVNEAPPVSMGQVGAWRG